jgi:flagellar motor protein MotB
MTKPIDSNDTDAGRQNNRRVEFHILEKDGKPLSE